jgi:predicted transcriptional regulator
MSGTETAKLIGAVCAARDIVCAYLSKNSIQPAALPDLISSVYMTIDSLGQSKLAEHDSRGAFIPIKNTVTADYIISLEDGGHYKSLRRHLAGRGLTPEAYRAKWRLPPDYPMVASNYAKKRSEIAKAVGLGRRPTNSEGAANHSPVRKRAPKL